MQKLRERLERIGIGLELTEGAKAFLMEKGWDPDMGARPLRRCLEHYVEDEIAEKLVREEIRNGETLLVDGTEKAEQLSISRKEI